MKKYFLIPILLLLLTATSCFEDLDDNEQIASTEDINDFIYRGLNFFYLYKADTPELANDAFASTDAKNLFIKNFDTPEDIFEFLKSDQDRFSRLFSNYLALEDALSGITLNNGMEYGLVRYPDLGGNIFGYVRLVLPNTSAEDAGLERGVYFNTIDGTQLTEDNYSDLFAQNNYTIGLATYDGTTITATGETASLTKEQYTENPVYLTKTIDLGGTKVGYIMYNAFTASFDEDLNAAFGQLKAEGVTELVLDLRYNSGGSVRSATDLSGMITGQFTGDIFYTEQWNVDRQDDYASNGLFTNETRNGNSLNSLNLTRVHILTSAATASASELVINGLAPYINVVQVGTNTTGKFQASTILYDAPSPDFSRSEANPGHTYAMLPLIFKTANAVGNTDYVDGLIPDIEQDVDFTNLGQLGNTEEPLLAAALNNIMPGPVAPPTRSSSFAKELDLKFDMQIMLVE
jgi:C-terminal processing protease CtpA/Prc